MKEQTMQKVFLFALLLFMFISWGWVIAYWDYMPFTDESATVSAVENLIREGVPRVGVTKATVNYDIPPRGHYYWTYIVECIIRIPMQLLSNFLGCNNLQALTNLIYVGIVLLFMYKYAKKANRDYIYIFTLTVIVIMCSSGFMSLVHYVRYYCLAMMSFLLAIYLIPIFIEELIKNNYLKKIPIIIFLGMLPLLFHPFYGPWGLCVIGILFFHLKNNGFMHKKIKWLFISAVIIIIVSFLYIFFQSKYNFSEIFSINILYDYIDNIVTWNIFSLTIAIVAVCILIINYKNRKI